MVKIISQGLLPRDHPMFTGELETFSAPALNLSATTSPPQNLGDLAINSLETEEDGRLTEGLRRLKVRRQAQQGLWDQTKASTQ
jgi:hypothetical protein